MADRGLDISYETVRRWVVKFGRSYARSLQRFRPKPDDRWHLDEMFVTIRGKRMYLWRAVDTEGEVLDFLIQRRRNKTAALKLMRKLLRKHGVPLLVAVDKVAASGGYLMAVVADRILAAPFAVLGSIGVVAQVPNVHRLLKRHDVDVEVLTAGKYKRTLTVLGENTEEGRQKFQEELEDVHDQFQEFVGEHRPQVDLSVVATGETWHGQRALALNLADELCTSDEYLLAASESADIYEVRWVEHRRPIERLMAQVESGIETMADRMFDKLSRWRGSP